MEIEDIKKLDKAITVAVYRKNTRSEKYYMLVTTKHVDVVNNLNARKPVIDNKYEIVELGVGGEKCITQWMKRYGIKKYDFVE